MDIKKAANYISIHAKPASQGLCARYVANGLQYAGFKFNRQSAAYMYNKELAKLGFKKIPYNKKYIKQIGDIAIFDKNQYHPYGHITMWCGNNWISDFIQRNMNPYKLQNTAGTITIWRYVNG